ncbi:hypothetical protein YC2023_109120 [Brassica napus]
MIIQTVMESSDLHASFSHIAFWVPDSNRDMRVQKKKPICSLLDFRPEHVFSCWFWFSFLDPRKMSMPKRQFIRVFIPMTTRKEEGNYRSVRRVPARRTLKRYYAIGVAKLATI